MDYLGSTVLITFIDRTSHFHYCSNMDTHTNTVRGQTGRTLKSIALFRQKSRAFSRPVDFSLCYEISSFIACYMLYVMSTIDYRAIFIFPPFLLARKILFLVLFE